MSERIGHAQIEIEEIERNTNTSFQNDRQGTLILEGNKERFSTEIGVLSPNMNYFAVYERTEMLTGQENQSQKSMRLHMFKTRNQSPHKFLRD